MNTQSRTSIGKEVNVMGGLLEGLIAVLGLMAGIIVTIITLVTGEVPRAGEGSGSVTHPRTIHPNQGRLAA